MPGLGVDEVDASVVADDVDVTLGVGGETAGDGGEVGESGGERVFERENEVFEGRGWGSEQDPLLDVMTGQHWKVRNREFEWFEGGFVVGMDEAS